MLHLDLTGAKKLDHITPIMAPLHFVPFHLRIKFKMYFDDVVFKALTGQALTYMTSLIHLHTIPLFLYI